MAIIYTYKLTPPTLEDTIIISESVDKNKTKQITIEDLKDLFKSNFFVSAPSEPDSPGKEGDFAYDDDYLYVCVQDNSWKRVRWRLWVSYSGGGGGA